MMIKKVSHVEVCDDNCTIKLHHPDGYVTGVLLEPMQPFPVADTTAVIEVGRVVYEAKDGTRLYRDLPMSKAQPIGTVVVKKGKKYKRIASAGTSSPPIWKPYVSNRLPRNMEGCSCDPQGKPIIETQAQERNVSSRLGWERE